VWGVGLLTTWPAQGDLNGLDACLEQAQEEERIIRQDDARARARDDPLRERWHATAMESSSETMMEALMAGALAGDADAIEDALARASAETREGAFLEDNDLLY